MLNIYLKWAKIKVLTCRLKTHNIPCIPKGGGYGAKKAKSQIKS